VPDATGDRCADRVEGAIMAAGMGGDSPGYAYRPALDGIRGLAVVVVVLFHGGVRQLRGGFLGVDAFFVLSGFLITSLLLTEQAERGRVALAAFWGRRARRLLPALLMVLIAVTVAGRYLLPPVEIGLLRGVALAALGYVANWRMIYRGSDYFAQTAAPSPLQHTWSLGIEEQFYLLWPLLVVAALALLGARRARTTLLALSVLGIVGSAAASWMLYRPDDVNRAYFGTDSRAQALLVGCAVALVLSRTPGTVTTVGRHRRRSTLTTEGPHRLLGTLALLGGMATAWLWTRADGTDGWLYQGGLTGLALAVAAVLAHAVVSPLSPTARLLSAPPLVWLGRISYGVYLWHWPLFQFVTGERVHRSGPALLGLRCALTLAVALGSYLLVEQPIRRGGWLRQLPRPVPVVGTVVAAALTAIVAVLVTGPPAAPTPAIAGGRLALTVPAGPTSGPSQARGSGQRSPTPPMLRAGRRPGEQPRVDIFGDSVAWTLGTYLPPHPGVTVTTRAIQGCGITMRNQILEMGTPHALYPYCPSWPDRWQAGVDTDDPDVSVILLNRWELMDAKVDGAYQHVGQAPFDAYLTGQLDQAMRIAGAHGASVVLLTAAYTHRTERPDGGLYDEDQPARIDAWNALLRRAAAQHADTVTVLDLAALVCPNGKFTSTVNGVPMRSDGLHFTPSGVHKIIAPWLLPRLSALAVTGAYPS
jgi:peptidoglycan/LPS O-acetylase OafA/YrhL